MMSQDEVSNKLGITRECKRRTTTRYEMISGHRRKRALEVLMMYNVDVYIYDLSDDVATVYENLEGESEITYLYYINPSDFNN